MVRAVGALHGGVERALARTSASQMVGPAWPATPPMQQAVCDMSQNGPPAARASALSNLFNAAPAGPNPFIIFHAGAWPARAPHNAQRAEVAII